MTTLLFRLPKTNHLTPLILTIELVDNAKSCLPSKSDFSRREQMAHLPIKVYRHLPDLYVLAGLFVALNIHHPIGVLSSLLLIGAGLFVFHYRLQHRSPKENSRRPRSR
jgi:hypothetical protein